MDTPPTETPPATPIESTLTESTPIESTPTDSPAGTPTEMTPQITEAGPPRREHAYAALRARLMSGDFSFRDRLAEERVATLLGVSRTPVREALTRLAADGLVEKRPDGGYYPTEPDLAGLRDLYEIRVTLELRGLERARELDTRHDPALLEPLRERWRALETDPPTPDPAFVSMDEDFHITLSQASGNIELATMLAAVNARIRPVRMYDFLTEDRVHLTVEQHLGIVEKVLANRLDDAVGALRSHVGESMEVVERRATRAITQMVLHRGRAAGRPKPMPG